MSKNFTESSSSSYFLPPHSPSQSLDIDQPLQQDLSPKGDPSQFHFLSYRGRKDQPPLYKAATMSAGSPNPTNNDSSRGTNNNGDLNGSDDPELLATNILSTASKDASDETKDKSQDFTIEKGLLSFQSIHQDSSPTSPDPNHNQPLSPIQPTLTHSETSPSKLPSSPSNSRTVAVRADTEKDSQTLSNYSYENETYSDASSSFIEYPSTLLALQNQQEPPHHSPLAYNIFPNAKQEEEENSITSTAEKYDTGFQKNTSFVSSVDPSGSTPPRSSTPINSVNQPPSSSSFNSPFSPSIVPPDPTNQPTSNSPSPSAIKSHSSSPNNLFSAQPLRVTQDNATLAATEELLKGLTIEEKSTGTSSFETNANSFNATTHSPNGNLWQNSSGKNCFVSRTVLNDYSQHSSHQFLGTDVVAVTNEENKSGNTHPNSDYLGSKQYLEHEQDVVPPQEDSVLIHNPTNSGSTTPPASINSRLLSVESSQLPGSSALNSGIQPLPRTSPLPNEDPSGRLVVASGGSQHAAPEQHLTVDGSMPFPAHDDEDDGYTSSSSDDSIHDRTQHILQRASSYKFSLSPSDNESFLGDAINLDLSKKKAPRGLKEESKAIETLQQENFELKIRIVCMEEQAARSSETGVAELQKQLVAAQAARIAMKHENEKLRLTISTLKTTHDDDASYNETILELQEELEEYKQYNSQLQEETVTLQEALDQAEETITEQNESIESYKTNINELIIQKEQLEEDLAAEKQSKSSSHHNLNSLASSLQAQNESLRKQLDTSQGNNNTTSPPTPRHATRVIEQHFYSIQRALNIPTTNSVSSPSRAGSRPNSRLSSNTAGSTTSLDLVDISDDNSVLSNMLNEIQTAAWDVSNKYRECLADYENLQHEYETLKEAHDEEISEWTKFKDDSADKIDLLDKEIQVRDLKIAEQEQLFKNQMAEISGEIEEISSGKDDKILALIDQLKVLQRDYDTVQIELRSFNDDVDQLSKSLSQKDEEVLAHKNKVELLTQQLEEKKQDIAAKEEEISLKDQEIGTKERRLEELRVSYSNIKEDAKQNVLEIKNLKELVKSLRSTTDKLEINALCEGLDSVTISTTDAQDLIEDILRRTKDALNNSISVSVESLRDTLDNIFEDYRNIPVLTAKLDETTAQNTRLFTNLEEQRKQVVEQRKKLEAQQEELQAELEAKTKTEADLLAQLESVESRHTAENKQLRDELEQNQNEEQILREGLDGVHQELTDVRTLCEALEAENAQLKEKLTDEDRLTPDQFQQLSNDFERIAGKMEELEMDRKVIVKENDKLQQLRQELEQQTEALRKADISNQHTIHELESRMADLNHRNDELLVELEHKSGKLLEVSRENAALLHENNVLRESYDDLTAQVDELEQQIQEASFTSEAGGAGNSRTKDHQAYRRVLELEEEVQISRDRIKGLDNDLRRYRDKLNRRGSEFSSVLRDITSYLSKVLDPEWTNSVTIAVEEIHRHPGSPIENFSRIGNLICDGFRMLEAKKRKYKSMAERALGNKSNGSVHSSSSSTDGSSPGRGNKKNKPAYEPQSNTIAALNNLENNAQIKQLSQQYELLDQKTIDTVGGDIALKVWQYRFMDMKKRYEMEREQRKLEYENYNSSVRQLEDRYLHDRSNHMRYAFRSPSASGAPMPGRVQDIKSSIEKMAAAEAGSGGHGTGRMSPLPLPVQYGGISGARPYSRASDRSRSSSNGQPR